jgi:hypothetical protein
VKSKTSAEFWRLFYDLPIEIQRLADKNYVIWQDNPRHPSLRFKPIRAGQWSVRVGDHYRAVGHFEEKSIFLWTWIGTHEDYNKL